MVIFYFAFYFVVNLIYDNRVRFSIAIIAVLNIYLVFSRALGSFFFGLRDTIRTITVNTQKTATPNKLISKINLLRHRDLQKIYLSKPRELQE
jgi:hypothetical protein